jgi:hypothetical protein
VLAQEPRFALKGGTAINLFEHDLARLSVDIDLAWLPVHDFAEDAKLIAKALGRLADALRARPLQLQVQLSAGEGTGTVMRLVASRGRACANRDDAGHARYGASGAQHGRAPRVEEAFGFAEVQVLDFADLYAGKLAAALSRQHPRDLFDVGLLLEDERADQALWRTFLVYLTFSPKPAWEMLAPRVPADFATFDAHFKGMTAEPIDAEALLESRERLFARVAGWLDEPSCALLRSVEGEQPNFGLIALPHASELPAVRRKLHNLTQRAAAKRATDRAQFEEALARIAGPRQWR